MHAVLPSLCTGCELCVPPCPVDCIALQPAGRAWTPDDAARGARSLRGARNAAGAQRAHRQARGRRSLRTMRRRIGAAAGRGGRRAGARARAPRNSPSRSHEPRRSSRASRVLLLSLVASLLDGFRRLSQTRPTIFPQRLDTLWDFGKPAESEDALSRRARASHPPASREALETSTQIARTQGLRRKFADADATLDGVAAEARPGAGARARPLSAGTRAARAIPAATSAAAVAAVRGRARAAAIATRCRAPSSTRRRAAHAGHRGAAGRAARLEPEGARRGGSVDRSARARLARLALQQHRLDLFRRRRRRQRRSTTGRRRCRCARRRATPARLRVAKWTVARGYRAHGQARRRRSDAAGARGRNWKRRANPTATSTRSWRRSRSRAATRRGAAPWAAKAHALLKDDA